MYFGAVPGSRSNDLDDGMRIDDEGDTRLDSDAVSDIPLPSLSLSLPETRVAPSESGHLVLS